VRSNVKHVLIVAVVAVFLLLSLINAVVELVR
jgi:hypothetical protein